MINCLCGRKENFAFDGEDVKTKTEGSHVQQYGIIAWAKDEVLSNYQGDVVSLIDKIFNKVQQCANKLYYLFNKENKMDIKLVHVPKFHCELNPIEMYWAYLKYYFKKHNDQSTSEDKVTKRILEAREQYASSDVNSRLFSRFWRITNAYFAGKTYAEIMKEYFNAGTEIKSHRKIIRKDDD